MLCCSGFQDPEKTESDEVDGKQCALGNLWDFINKLQQLGRSPVSQTHGKMKSHMLLGNTEQMIVKWRFMSLPLRVGSQNNYNVIIGGPDESAGETASLADNLNEFL